MSTKIVLEYPYNQIWKSGYLNTNSEGRKTLTLYNSPTDRSSCQYARYLLAVHLKRFLTDDEEVDHINNDKTDDSIKNLQLLSKKENRDKTNHSKGIAMIEFECPICNVIFSKEKRSTYNKNIITCSRKCGGKASHLIHMERPIRIIREWRDFKYL